MRSHIMWHCGISGGAFSGRSPDSFLKESPWKNTPKVMNRLFLPISNTGGVENNPSLKKNYRLGYRKRWNEFAAKRKFCDPQERLKNSKLCLVSWTWNENSLYNIFFNYYSRLIILIFYFLNSYKNIENY